MANEETWFSMDAVEEEFNNKRRKDGLEAIELLKRLQTAHPHMRIGQLISNAVNNDPFIFHIENKELVSRLRRDIALYADADADADADANPSDPDPSSSSK